jgi:hypothetical protein
VGGRGSQHSADLICTLPTCAGENVYIYIYIYIYMCVCVSWLVSTFLCTHIHTVSNSFAQDWPLTAGPTRNQSSRVCARDSIALGLVSATTQRQHSCDERERERERERKEKKRETLTHLFCGHFGVEPAQHGVVGGQDRGHAVVDGFKLVRCVERHNAARWLLVCVMSPR